MPDTSDFLILGNCQAARLEQLPLLPFDTFKSNVLNAMTDCHLSAFFAWNGRLVALLSNDTNGTLMLSSTKADKSYPAFTPDCAAFHWFERELHEQTGIVPEGHPWLKPIRFINGNIGDTSFFTPQGSEIHEVAVGPVHAGVIEPSHFRFQCIGENVMSLEISLGYQHRGIEKLLLNGPDSRTQHLMETIAGDSSTSYAGAYSGILHALDANAKLSKRTNALRMLAWELERIANHIGDLGALAGDVAFLPTSSFCGRIRGDFLNMTAMLCGNRFGRGLVTPEGIGFRMDNKLAEHLLDLVNTNAKDLNNALELMFDEPTVLDRFENTGTVSTAVASSIGMVGTAARASGLKRDVRISHPYCDYTSLISEYLSEKNGDVLARASIRRQELKSSLQIINNILNNLPAEETDIAPTQIAANSIAVSLVEGWRGEICHIAITDADSRFQCYKTIDPSFHNWFGLAMALRNEQISNFPICNKSFNLSYCGHDL